MKKKFLLICLFFSGCGEEKLNVKDFMINNKYCIQVCMEYQFKMFHNNGHSWGTGSSSLSGLSQEKIFDRVKEECTEFYQDETCCKRPYGDYKNTVVQTHVHGYDYGACVK